MKAKRDSSADGRGADRGGSATLKAVVWSLGASFFLYAFLQRVAPSVMVDAMMLEFSVGAAVAGTLSAAYFYTYAAMQLPCGLLMDRFGPKRLLTAAGLASVVGTLIMAMADSVTGAMAGRALVGLSVSFAWVGILGLNVQLYPAERFAAMAGLAQMFGMSGAIIGQAPLGLLVSWTDWRTAMMAIACFGLFLSIAIWIGAPSYRRPVVAQSSLRADLASVAGNAQTWLIGLAAAAMTAPMLTFGGLWAVKFLEVAYGYGGAKAGGILAFLFVGWAAGAPLSGLLSDRMKKRKQPLLAGILLAAASLCCVIYWPELPAVLLALLLFLHGLGAAAMTLAFASVREANRPGVGGAACGLVNTMVVGSGALFQPFVGFLLDIRWDGTVTQAGAPIYAAEDFMAVLTILPIVLGVGFLAGLLTRETYGARPLPPR